MPDGMSSREIRRLFIDYFTDRGHEKVESAPLIPRDDPTLLFTSAGMVPFKSYYIDENPPLRRAVSVQRCLRLSDLDEVGKTPYHATFFEMLGNFSFGDYFKEQTIQWGWEFLTDVMRLPADRLWVTVHKDDPAAAEIWRTKMKFPVDRLVALGDEDNFWGPAGDSGPCGPCSEIHLDMGAEVGCGRPGCDPGCDCDRFFEIWNLVFPQFLQHTDGTRETLKRPGIDTGMGFERLCSVVQGADEHYETDTGLMVLAAVRDEAEAASGTRPPEGRPGAELVVIADHARAATFAIAENILPSNEAQGYVIRRLIRRAVRRGLTLGIEEPFLYRIVGAVVDAIGDAHPHLVQKREHLALVMKSEEERFHETLTQGSAVFEEMLESLSASGTRVIPGDVAFSLYDTYGFPLDLTEEMAAERGVTVDTDGFAAAMEEQKERGRRASMFGDADGGGAWEGKRATTAFVGYELPCNCGEGSECETAESLLSGPVAVNVAEVRRSSEDLVEFTLDESPFYAESGGQVADTGTLTVGGSDRSCRQRAHARRALGTRGERPGRGRGAGRCRRGSRRRGKEAADREEPHGNASPAGRSQGRAGRPRSPVGVVGRSGPPEIRLHPLLGALRARAFRHRGPGERVGAGRRAGRAREHGDRGGARARGHGALRREVRLRGSRRLRRLRGIEGEPGAVRRHARGADRRDRVVRGDRRIERGGRRKTDRGGDRTGGGSARPPQRRTRP